MALCLMLSLMPEAWAADQSIASGDCGINAHWIFTADTGVLRIHGSGAMEKYSSTSAAPWQIYGGNITSVVIEASVESIGDYAFSGCTKLAAISIPKTVTEIGSAAFLSCDNLRNIYYAGTQAEWDNVQKAANVLPAGAAVTPEDEVPTNSGSCGTGVRWEFLESTDGTEGTLTIIGTGPMVFENGRIPWASFRDKMTKVIIGEGVTEIAGGAFALSTKLKEIDIPKSVTEIGGSTFIGIPADAVVYYAGSTQMWGEITGPGVQELADIKIEYNHYQLKITYDPGAGSGTPCTETVVAGRDYRLPLANNLGFSAPTYDGGSISNPQQLPKEFRGWLLGDGTTVYPADYIFQSTSNTTFTAWWDIPDTGDNKIIFRHRYNNGTKEYSDEKDNEIEFKKSEKDQVLRIGTPTKPGYTFDGWSSLANPGELNPTDIIVPGGSDGILTYIANWSGDTHYIKVMGPNGPVNQGKSDQAEYIVSPEKQEVKVKVPVADGMTWVLKEDGYPTLEIQQANPDAPGEAMVTIPADYHNDITLRGAFKPNTYALIWDANGGNWGQDTDGKDIPKLNGIYEFAPENDRPVAVPTTPSLNSPLGYDFDGWETGEGVTYDAEHNQINIKAGTFGDLTISAKWKEKDYTVTWKANGGYWSKAEDGTEDNGDKATEYTIKDKTLTHEPPERDGYVFRGWECKKASDQAEVKVTQPDGDYSTVNLPEKPEDYLGNLVLTAIWVEEHTVTLDPNNNIEGEKPRTFTVVDGDEYTLPTIGETEFTSPDASKTFKGWQVEGDATGTIYQPGKKYVVSADTTFQAVWGDVEYSVTYEANNGTEEPDFIDKVVHGKEYKLLAPETCHFTTPVGKAFLYWKVEGQTRKYQPGDTLPNTQGDLSVTAVWGDEEYTVTFDGNGGSGTMAPEVGLTYNQLYTLPKCAFTPPEAAHDPDNPDAELPEYVFVAWEIDGKEYLPGSVISIQKTITAKAIWVNKADLVEYTLSYAPGGGTGTMEADPFFVRTAGVSVNVPLPSTCDFTFAEMEFAGWQVGGKRYEPGMSAPISGDTTATALWRGRIAYVEGGNVTKPDTYIYSDSSQQLEMDVTTPTKPGYIFEKWTWDNEDVALYGHIIDLPGKFSGTLTLTGEWDENENVYLVTYDPNGGTGPQKEVEVEKKPDGEATTHILLNYEDCTFTPPAGMEFDCWLVGETKAKPGEKIPVAGHTKVIAQWKDQTVDPDAPDQTVTFDPGEGSGTMEAVTVKKGQWYDLPECAFEAPEGKEFDCWSIDGVRQEESRILIEGDVTLTALWKDKEPEPEDPNKPWTITFDAGGGTGTMSPVTVPKAEGGATYTLPACSFTAPEGKTFQAWQFDGQEYAPGAVITITGDTTITAVWKDAEVKPPKPTSWKITYNLNGGYMTGSGPTSYNLSDQAQTLNVPVPYKSGYTFLGWTYSGVSKPTKSVIIRANMTGDLTVVANWQMNPGAGGSNNTSQGYYISVSATAGGEIIIPWEYASQGVTVSVQARPQPGYEVGSVTVVNSQGFEVGDLRDLGGGSYSFTMPGYRVNVSATFKLQSAAAGPISRPVMNYEDVRLGDWYYDSVEYVYNRGMMSGVSATQFGPNGQATRGAIWTALAAHAGFDINGGATWYERGQYWAVNRGITDGESPSGNITREQLVTMLWRYKGSPAVFGGDLWQFSDGYAVSPYAMDAMRWAVSTGLIGGANGRLNPQASTTRAEAATILARFCQS